MRQNLDPLGMHYHYLTENFHRLHEVVGDGPSMDTFHIKNKISTLNVLASSPKIWKSFVKA